MHSYSYLNEYGSDTDEDNIDEEYIDEETRIDQILDLFHNLQDKQKTELDMFEQVKVVLNNNDMLTRDIVNYVIMPYLAGPELPEIQGLTRVEIVPNIDTQVEEWFQPYDLPPCEVQRVWTEPKYSSYIWDDEVTEKRQFYGKMIFVSLAGYHKRDWYKCRRDFYSTRKWWKRFYRVKQLWFTFYLMLCPKLEEGYWDSSFYELKWTYTLNNIRQEKELSVKEVIKTANLFLWFEIPDKELNEGSVDVQLQLRDSADLIIFESKKYTIK